VTADEYFRLFPNEADERRFQRCVRQAPYLAQAVTRVMAARLRRNDVSPA
jgi:hypothetical protein